MEYPFRLADELIPVLAVYKSQPPAPAGTTMQDAFRMALIAAAEQSKISSTEELKVEDAFFKSVNSYNIRLRVYSPANAVGQMPCLYWIHGGGTMSGLPEQDDQVVSGIALRAGCVVVSVDYRLAPEHPYPEPLNDCYDGLAYVANNPLVFKIDSNKIAIGGGSAGGMLAASCAILARDRKGPKIIHQSLVYPMLDHRGQTRSSYEITDVGVWDRKMNLYGWQCYLKNVADNIPDIAVPVLVKDLSGLPPAFLAVGSMDVLRDETIYYAQQLAAAGTIAELHIYPGMVHVFDSLVPESVASKDMSAARVSALKRAFQQT